MQWDDEYFYIAAELEESHVWGTLTQHDAVIFHDNDFELFVDPNSDSHEYFEFEMNALNTGWDLFLPKPYKDGGSADNGWGIPGLKTAARVNGTLNDSRNRDKGWTLEMGIPWKAFGQAARMPLPPVAGHVWRVNFSRVEWRHEIHEGKYGRVPGTKEDNWVWSPQGKVNMHLPERWGYVQFAEKAGGGFGGDPAWATKRPPAREWKCGIRPTGCGEPALAACAFARTRKSSAIKEALPESQPRAAWPPRRSA